MNRNHENRQEFDFETAPNPALSVKNVAGDVMIRAGSESRIQIQAEMRGKPHAIEHTRVAATMVDNHVRVETVHDGNGDDASKRSLATVDYDISVPIGCRVRVHTVRGDVNVIGTRAGVEVESVSGDVSLVTVLGEIHISTTSGDVQAQQVEGVLRVQTTNGDVHLGDSRLSEFNIHSTNGDFHIETPLVAGHHYFAKTLNGDVTLSVPQGTGITVQLRTLNGDVGTSMPVEIISNSKRNWQGRINGGGANVEMESLNGDLHIRESENTAAGWTDSQSEASVPAGATGNGDASDVPQFGRRMYGAWGAGEPEQESANDTISILARLEQGEITVEAAMARLDALRR